MKVEFFSGGSGGGGTDTNIGNTNLISTDTARTYKVGSGGFMELQTNAGTNVLQINDNGNVVVGGGTPYTLPSARGTQNEVLGLTNGTGTAAWRTIASDVQFATQSQCGNGQILDGLARNEHYVPDVRNRLVSVGLGGSAPDFLTMNNVLQNQLVPPFRMFTQSNIGLGGNSDSINIQYNMSFQSEHWFNIIAVRNDGSLNAPVLITRIASFIALPLAELNFWKCVEVALPQSLGAACTSYYLSMLVLDNAGKSVGMQFSAMYNNSPQLAVSFS